MEEVLTRLIESESILSDHVKELVWESPEDELDMVLKNWVQSIVDGCDYETGSGFESECNDPRLIGLIASSLVQSWINQANWDKIAVYFRNKYGGQQNG
ncbi:MAG TPA: hypothetical protein V6C65_14145 [Allocoleopsis sp.]